MDNVITLTDQIARARATKARLWNPPNARYSSETDITSESERRKRQSDMLRQQREAQQAAEDFHKRQKIDDMIRDAVAEHVRAKEIAQKLLAEEPPEHTTIGKVLTAVSAYYTKSITEIRSHRRTADVVRPRQVAMYLCREHTLCSLPQISDRMGKRDHTTVLHGWRKINALIAIDDQLAAEIRALKEALGLG
jgi:chromosomal replication initiation ATPase DnaA